MPRAQFRDTVMLRNRLTDVLSVAPPGASAAIYDVGTSSPIAEPIYADGYSAVTLPNPLLTGNDGNLEFWTTAERALDIEISFPGYVIVRITVSTDSAGGGGMTQAQADARYLQLTGGVVSGSLSVSGVISGSGAVPTGGTTGQVLTKNSATNYDVVWQTPSGGGLSLPLTQNLTFSPDNTYDIGATAANRPRDLFVGRNATIAGILAVTGQSNLATIFAAGSLTFQTDNTYDIGAAAANRPRDLFVGRNAAISGTLSVSSYEQLAEIAKPANPAAGQVRLYPKADHHLYQLDSTGTETDLTLSGTGGITLPLSQNLTFAPDNTFDVGTNATTNRPRDLWLGRNATIGGILAVTGQSNLATIFAAGNLTFATDNAYDIGASGANRPRNLYLAGNATVGGTITGNGSVPTGGTAGQVLTKNTNTNYDLVWTTPAAGVSYPLLAPNGLVSAPSYSFSASTGTGLYSPTINQVAISAGGTQVWLGTSTGASVTGTFGVSGATTLSSTLAVTAQSNLASIFAAGNLTFQTDNTYDIGAAAANRPRDLFLARNAAIGGTLTVTGNSSLSTLSTSGLATLNSASITNNATVGGTLGVTGTSTFAATVHGGAATFSPDNTYDIGAAGATRPRNVYVASSFVNRTKAGVPIDSDVTNPADGMVVVNTSANAMYFRSSATWVQLGVAGSVSYPLLAPNGAVGAPSYAFSASTNTGMYSPTTSQLALSAGGTQVLLATSTTLTIPVAASLSSTLSVTGQSSLASIFAAGNVTFQTDNTYDIGASAANRPRDLFLARNATIGGTLGVTGATTLAGLSATTISASGLVSATLGLTVTGANTSVTTLSSSGLATLNSLTVTPGTTTLAATVHSGAVTFSPDNTYDVGAAGATRPRNVYVAGAFVNRTKAGVPIDADVTNPADGMVIINTSTNVLYFRSGAAWTTAGGGAPTYPLLAPNGAVGAPSYAFSASTNTGMYSPTTSQLALSAGGTQVLLATSTTLTIPVAASLSSTLSVTGQSSLANIFAAGNLTFQTDNTYDIGASGANRPRNLFLAGNATIGGTLGVTGASTLAGLTCTTLTASGAATLQSTLAVTSTSQLSGNVGIGGASSASQGLRVISAGLTGLTQYGALIAPITTNAATTMGAAIAAQAGTAAAAFTQVESTDFLALGPAFGAGSVITSAIGFHAQNQGNANVTNAYGIYIDAQSGASTANIGLYNAGTTRLDGSLTWQTDNASDIGASGANRPRNLFLAGNATIGGTLGVSGASTLAGLTCTTLTASGAATLQSTLGVTGTSTFAATVHGGNATFSPDNTFDIGASGATRPRNLFLAGNATIGGTLGVTGATTLSSTLGVTGTSTFAATVFGGNATFSPDNTFDIGASAATRPRDLFLARNATIGGTLGVTGATTLSSTLSVGGNLTFGTDNTFDVGAVSLSRPRNVYVGGSFVNRTKAGVPVDTDVTNPADGMVIVNTSANAMYFRTSGTWTQLGVAGSVSYPLLAPNGAVGAPSYAFSASTNTGMYSPTTSQLGLSAGGTAVLTATSTTLTVPVALSVTSTTTLNNTLTVVASSGFQGTVSLTGSGGGLSISQTITGATSQSGIASTPTFSSGATTAGRAVLAQVVTQAAAFTMVSGYGVYVIAPTVGAASAITTEYGVRVENQGVAGITNAYGVYIAAQSGASTLNIGLFNAGSTRLDGRLDWATDNTNDIGVSGANRPRDLFLGRNLSVAGTTQLIGAVTLPSQTVTNANLATDVARLNQLVNGGFEIWQRGAGPFTGVAFTADRWATSLGGTSTISVSRDTVNVDTGSGACAAVTYTHNAQSWLSEFLEDTKQLVGRQISVSVRVRTSTASAVRVQIYAGTNATALIASSAYHTGGGTYETLRVTGTPTAGSPTLISVSISFEASCTAYLDNAMVVYGPNAGDYMPMPPADDLERCLRYYQVLGPNATASLEVSAYAGAGGTPSETFQYSPKAVVPTVTKVGTWAVANCSQPTIAGADTDSCYLTITVTAVGIGNTWNGNAGNKITVEANP